MQVAILGAGSVGTTLASAMIRAGHTVQLGVRTPDAVQLAGATILPLAEAVADVDIVILALPYAAVESVLKTISLPAGVVLVDATNPLGWDADGPFVAARGAETIAVLAPHARVVKAFSTYGAEHNATGGVDLHLAGDDAEARATVAALGESLGLRPLDCGPLRNAHALEHLAALWIHLALKGGHGRAVAFSLSTRKTAS